MEKQKCSECQERPRSDASATGRMRLHAVFPMVLEYSWRVFCAIIVTIVILGRSAADSLTREAVTPPVSESPY